MTRVDLYGALTALYGIVQYIQPGARLVLETESAKCKKSTLRSDKTQPPSPRNAQSHTSLSAITLDTFFTHAVRVRLMEIAWQRAVSGFLNVHGKSSRQFSQFLNAHGKNSQREESGVSIGVLPPVLSITSGAVELSLRCLSAYCETIDRSSARGRPIRPCKVQ